MQTAARLGAVFCLLLWGFNLAKAQEVIPFSYQTVTETGEGTVTLTMQKKWDKTKAKAEDIIPGGVVDFALKDSKVSKGYIKFEFRNLVDKSNDLTEVQILQKDFKSAPGCAVVFPQSSGIAYLKKGGWGTPVMFEVDQNTTYTFTVAFGVSTKPDAPPVVTVRRTYTFTVTGLGVEPVKVDTVPKGLSEEEIMAEWEYAQKQNTPAAYRNFIRKVGKGELVNQAKDLLKIEYTIARDKKRDDLFLISFFYPNLDNAPATKGDVSIAKVEGLNGPLAEEPDLNGWTKEGLQVILKDVFNPHILYPVDFAGRSLPKIELNASDARLEAKLNELGTDSIQILIKGGKPPYQLFFVLDDKGAADRLQFPGKITSTDFRLDKEKLARKLKVTIEGDYYIELVDDRGYSFLMEDRKLHLIPPPLIPAWLRTVIAVLGAIFLFIAFLVARRRRKKNQETERLLEELKKAKQKGGIQILPKEFRVNAHGFWRDSAISKVILTREFIQDINSYFVGRSFSEAPLVIGYLLGQIPNFSFETEQYEILLEKFALTQPFPPREHDQKWDMLKREIGRLAEYNPEQKVLGWVIMHRGQGDELLDSEQKIHGEHFPELYQVGMKIDLYEGKLDTAFFSRKRNGAMNKTSADRVTGAHSLPWNAEFIASGRY